MNVVEVFADVCWPFTHVGLRRLVQRGRAIDTDLMLRVLDDWNEGLQRGVIGRHTLLRR